MKYTELYEDQVPLIHAGLIICLKIHKKEIIIYFLYFEGITDSSSLNRLIEKTESVEIYNLAAQSHVNVSFEVIEYIADAVGTLRLLDVL